MKSAEAKSVHLNLLKTEYRKGYKKGIESSIPSNLEKQLRKQIIKEIRGAERRKIADNWRKNCDACMEAEREAGRQAVIKEVEDMAHYSKGDKALLMLIRNKTWQSLKKKGVRA